MRVGLNSALFISGLPQFSRSRRPIPEAFPYSLSSTERSRSWSYRTDSLAPPSPLSRPLIAPTSLRPDPSRLRERSVFSSYFPSLRYTLVRLYRAVPGYPSPDEKLEESPFLASVATDSRYSCASRLGCFFFYPSDFFLCVLPARVAKRVGTRKSTKNAQF